MDCESEMKKNELKCKKKPIINFIQSIATPHNNVLINQFLDDGFDLKLWYASSNDDVKYSWKEELSNKYFHSKIYGKKLNFFFLCHCIFHKNDRYIIVGWNNINTLLLHLIFFLLRRPFNHWTDMPKPLENKFWNFARFKRTCAHFILRNSNAKIFCVGKMTVDYFKKKNFLKKNLVNLPIFVEIENNNFSKNFFFNKNDYSKKNFLISAGSRLIYEKGFDLLIKSIANLPDKLKKKIKVVIVGKGPEKNNLNNLIRSMRLNNIVKIKKWMEFRDFKNLIERSDLFIQPSRFDSYGGSILAMSLGVAVIGSRGAGAAVDRIKNGHNGYLYNAHDFKSLTSYIKTLLNNRKLRRSIAINGKKTALKWPVTRGTKILLRNLI